MAGPPWGHISLSPVLPMRLTGCLTWGSWSCWTMCHPVESGAPRPSEVFLGIMLLYHIAWEKTPTQACAPLRQSLACSALQCSETAPHTILEGRSVREQVDSQLGCAQMQLQEHSLHLGLPLPLAWPEPSSDTLLSFWTCSWAS